MKEIMNVEATRTVCGSVLTNAISFGKIKAGYVPTSVMFIDGDYQRKPQSKIRKIAADWDNDKCGFLTVNYREEVGKFAIIDGQNRFTAARIANVDYLPCHILNGVSKEDEAKFFATQDENKTKVTPFDKFRAELYYGDETALKLKSMCDDFGIIIAPSSPKQTRHLRSVTTAKHIMEQSGERVLFWIFDVIQKANWHTTRRAYSAVMIRGLYGFYNHCATDGDVGIRKGALIMRLKEMSPDEVIRLSNGFHGDESIASGVTRFLLEITKY